MRSYLCCHYSAAAIQTAPLNCTIISPMNQIEEQYIGLAFYMPSFELANKLREWTITLKVTLNAEPGCFYICTCVFCFINTCSYSLYRLIKKNFLHVNKLMPCILPPDALLDFNQGELSVVGQNATAGIFATYPSSHLTLLNGFVDQVTSHTLLIARAISPRTLDSLRAHAEAQTDSCHAVASIWIHNFKEWNQPQL